MISSVNFSETVCLHFLAIRLTIKQIEEGTKSAMAVCWKAFSSKSRMANTTNIKLADNCTIRNLLELLRTSYRM